MKIHDAIVAGLLGLETVLTLPFFLVAWLCSAVVWSLVAGWQFARMPKESDKRTTLAQLLGQRRDK